MKDYTAGRILCKCSVSFKQTVLAFMAAENLTCKKSHSLQVFWRRSAII